MTILLCVAAAVLASCALYALWLVKRKPVEKPKQPRIHRVIPDNWPRK